MKKEFKMSNESKCGCEKGSAGGMLIGILIISVCLAPVLGLAVSAAAAAWLPELYASESLREIGVFAAAGASILIAFVAVAWIYAKADIERAKKCSAECQAGDMIECLHGCEETTKGKIYRVHAVDILHDGRVMVCLDANDMEKHDKGYYANRFKWVSRP